MRTGEVQANLVRLNEDFRLTQVPDLIARKTGGTERAVLDDTDFAFHHREYERLRLELEESSRLSQLPESASARGRLHDLLLRLRCDSNKK
jgi:hypothetical protein